jgi:PST family polysaccharide transporter
LLQRHFRQDRKMIADQVNNWLGAVVSIALAVVGWGAMSLAVGRIAGSLASGVLFVIFSPEPLRFGFDPGAARRLLRFGLPLAGSSVIVFAVANVDQLVVGNVLGATALGFYVLAFNLSQWPVSVFSQPVRSVAPAAFARLQDDPPTMRRAFLSTSRLLTGVTLPICLLMSGAAEPLIRFVYGPAWAPAAQALRWLAVLGGLRILFELIYDYFVVLARSRVVFTIQLVWLVALVPALIFGAHMAAIPGVGAAQLAVAALVVLPLYLRELAGVGIGVRAVLARIGPPALLAAGIGLFAAFAGRVISLDVLALGLAGAVTLVTLGLLVHRMRGTVAELRMTGRPDVA